MYLVIIFLPLIGSIISGFFGRKIGVQGAQLITSSFIIITTMLAILTFFEVGYNNIPLEINLFRWIDSESINILWGFYFDSLTVSMLIPVLIVSSLVHIYSIGYMSHDPHNQRFFSYLSLFTFMMIILVTANNYLLMFLGWEGVGVCSYLLVNFWFTRIAANQSSISAFLTNRVGDCFLTIGMFIIIWSFGNLDYSTVFSLAPYFNQDIITLIGICLLIGAMAKSSQIGLHVWLPQAMEGLLRALSKFHYMREHPILSRSTQIYILLGKILGKGQSARNFMGQIKGDLSIQHKGSSETTCEIDNNNIYLKNEFKYWFIGFTEGDGLFSVYKDKYLEFKITQSSNDAQILFYIKKELGFGSVMLQDKINKTHQFRVRKKESILKLIEIFNGNILTKHKNIQFANWIQAYNKLYNKNIIYKKNIIDINLNNSWLAGFTDSQGCFTVSTIKKNKYNSRQVTVRYILSQKGELDLLNKIALLLNGKVHYIKYYNGYNMVVNLTKLNNILNYLKLHKLKTKKLISYNNWLKVYILVKNKQHLIASGLEKINVLKKKINK
uniref:LAGLIDADG homing endonuclease n=1 Tax=Epidermophyton floccosum TaxID=34391 RepID=Q3ZEG6_EPIFL|nr:LAGLIDADG homing endonuclease [Epidermophyton floccosum]AAW78237.1 LAGLIDADG homing endonuclease [Epidermophyton floccosum]